MVVRSPGRFRWHGCVKENDPEQVLSGSIPSHAISIPSFHDLRLRLPCRFCRSCRRLLRPWVVGVDGILTSTTLETPPMECGADHPCGHAPLRKELLNGSERFLGSSFNTQFPGSLRSQGASNRAKNGSAEGQASSASLGPRLTRSSSIAFH
jgi:hypothetical protein